MGASLALTLPGSAAERVKGARILATVRLEYYFKLKRSRPAIVPGLELTKILSLKHFAAAQRGARRRKKGGRDGGFGRAACPGDRRQPRHRPGGRGGAERGRRHGD